jgi:hypothetical protein
MVFDGKKLKLKSETENERKINRETYKEKALECMKQNNTELAYRYFGLSIDVTFDMV